MSYLRARLLGVFGALGLAATIAACTGEIGAKGGGGPGGGGDGEGDTIDVTGPRTAPLCTSPATPRPVYLRRLSNAEYDRTVSDLLGVTVAAETMFGFPADTAAGGFRNNAENGTISTGHVSRYYEAAGRLVADLVASPSRRMALVGCDLGVASGRAACTEAFIRRFGRRAFRRPLTTAEVSGFTTLASSSSALDADPWAPAGVVVEAMLQSSDFLYRVELGTPDPARAGTAKLTAFEVATRLAYLLWGTTPDDALLDGAASGALDTPEGVASRARQMLADSRAHLSIQDFYQQWLRVEALDRASPSASAFPAWSETLRASMREETTRFVDDLVWRDGASFLDLLGGGATFVDSTLAAFYGMPAPSAAGFERATLDGAPTRAGGFLTQGTFLTVTSKNDRTSPTLRGRFVREALLCDKLRDPPADINTTLPTTVGQSVRERLEAHATNPACSACHAYMDPVGLGFERYDGIGAFHATDPAGAPISDEGKLLGYDAPEFAGPVELGQRILSTTSFPRCAAVHLFRYAFARRETTDDQCTTDRFYAAFRDSGYNLREMIAAMVSSDAFRYRKNDGGTQ